MQVSGYRVSENAYFPGTWVNTRRYAEEEPGLLVCSGSYQNALRFELYCCPGGACPAGFSAGCCSSPPPVHVGCYPGGVWPLVVSQLGGEILANATMLPRDIVSAIISAATNNVMRFLTLLTSSLFSPAPKGKPVHL